MSDNLKEVLDLVPESTTTEMVTFIPAEKPAKDDYEKVRENLLDIVDKGTKALDDIIGMAGQSQHPRFYEMISTHISTLVAANKALLEATKMQQSIDAADAEAELPAIEKGGKHVTNNLFVGSTTELAEMLKQIRSQ